MFTDRRASSLESRRVRQPWPADQPFKLLALDGGGIKGLYTAELLRLCEEQLAEGKPLANYFDMIAGTSTGGIVALGLGLGRTTHEIVEFYRQDGRRIFPSLPRSRLGRGWCTLRSFFRPSLNHAALEDALRKGFGDRLFGESTNRLVIPAFMMPKTEIAVFKTDHHADFRRDHSTPAWRIARATSAAPAYLKGHEHETSGRIFIDGGLWANNPVMVALVDVLSSYEIDPQQIQVLSIGTGNPPFELSPQSVFAGLLAWREVIKAAMFLTSDNATAQAKLLLGPEQVLRIEPEGADALVEMDDYDRALRELPSLAATHFADHRRRLGTFFQSCVETRERHYT